MAPKGPKRTTYQYKATDSPVTLGQQFGVTPQQIINANQGGYPFSNGQIISIPSPGGYGISQNGAVFGADIGTPAPQASFNYQTMPDLGYGRTPPANMNFYAQQYSQQFNQTGTTPTRGINPVWGEGRGDQAWRSLTQNITNANADLNGFFANLDATGQLDYNLLPSQLNLMTIRSLGLDAADLAELGFKQDPKTLNWIQQNKASAVAQANGAAAGNNDFMNTGFMQYNEANNIAFEDQLRWDPIKKQYRKIGQIQNDYGYLPNTEKKEMTKKERNARNKRLARERQARSSQQQQSSATSGNYSTETTVSFGAGSG